LPFPHGPGKGNLPEGSRLRQTVGRDRPGELRAGGAAEIGCLAQAGAPLEVGAITVTPDEAQVPRRRNDRDGQGSTRRDHGFAGNEIHFRREIDLTADGLVLIGHGGTG
jgi:hypothetical protein